MRLLVLLLAFPFAASAAAPGDDGFIWIDANTRIKVVKPVSAGTGATAPEKAPEPKDKKEEPKK